MPSPTATNGIGSKNKGIQIKTTVSDEDDTSRQRAHTFGGVPSTDSVDVVLRPSKSDIVSTMPHHKLDKFGFILNMDNDGRIVRDVPVRINGAVAAAATFPSAADELQTRRRLQKWDKMIASWTTTTTTTTMPTTTNTLSTRRQQKRLKRRLRKGIPDQLRTQVWMLMANVPQTMADNPGVYDSLVRQTFSSSPTNGNGNGTIATATIESPHDDDEIHFSQTKSFLIVQETIERDIHRTFPRHSMFYDVDEDSITGNIHGGVCGAATTEFSKLIQDLNGSATQQQQREDRMSPRTILQDKGGQASLRRLLKAYSVYDRDVGYCQGMNFIAGMLLTLMEEEQAFWLFTAIMHGKPCQMHGMFGEGMSETHKVLYVAEKLIQQFLPKLYKHLDREHVHITMFATQWLLTQYTSSFHFDLVTRIWDCFLVEGWKVTYRIMLALLMQIQAKLLKMSFEEILAFFRTMPEQVDGQATVDAALKIPLRRAHIVKYEKEWEAQQAAKSTAKSR